MIGPKLTQRLVRSSLLSLLLATHVLYSSAVNYVYDETAWTKSKWEDFKIDNPLQQFNPSDEATEAAEFTKRLPDYPLNSLDGPFTRSLQSTIKDTTPQDNKLAEVLDDLEFVAPASQAVQCTVCHALIALAWNWAVEETHAGIELNTAKAKEFMEEACEAELGTSVLSKYMIYKMDAESQGAALVFFVIRERKKALGPTATEVVAVQSSCQGLVRELGSELVAGLLESLALYRQEMLRVLQDHGVDLQTFVSQSLNHKQKVADASTAQAAQRKLQADSGNEDETDEYLDDEEAKKDMPEDLDPDCLDLNQQCESWADAGECQRNPNYMVGDPPAGVVGHCRKACGACKPRQRGAAPALEAHPAAKAELEAASKALLQKLKNTGCGASTACLTGVSGMALSGGMIKVGPALGQNTGFVLGKPSWGTPLASKLNADQQARMPKPGSFAHPPSSQAALVQKVHRVLHNGLAGKVIAMPGPPEDFFTYEYVYQGYIYQYHMDSNRKVTESWHLGKFAEQLVKSKAGHQLLLDRLDLLPKRKMEKERWPYVQQAYMNGDNCELAGGKKNKRSTEVRIACSPDEDMHMLIREPDFCKYIIVLYVPELCSVEEMKPMPAAPAAPAQAEE